MNEKFEKWFEQRFPVTSSAAKAEFEIGTLAKSFALDGWQAAIHRVERDESAIAQLKEACIKAHAEVNVLVDRAIGLKVTAALEIGHVS